MPEPTTIPTDIKIREWVGEAKADPVKYRSRQITEILLTAIGITESLKDCLILKGGTLMALGFRSTRVTADVDFTTNSEPEDLPERLQEELDEGLSRARAQLGYLDIDCRVQTIKKRPRTENFPEYDFPALEVKIAYAEIGGRGEERLKKGIGSDTVKVEISFREQVMAFQHLHLSGGGVAILAYSKTEVVAEKFRALLQQPILRGKSRRQDVYDIALLIKSCNFNKDECAQILSTLIEKCRTRDVPVNRDAIDVPEIRQLAFKEWHTLKDEMDELPDFDELFKVVSKFYRSLPWP